MTWEIWVPQLAALIASLIAASSPIILMKMAAQDRLATEERARAQIEAARAAKIAADGAAALARENIRQQVETNQTLRKVEDNVNGRFGRQSEIAEIAQTDAAQMRTAVANITVLLAQLLDKQPGAVDKAKEVLAEPIPPPPDLPPPMQSIPSAPDREK